MAYSIVEPTADETETEEIEQQMRDLDQVVESFEDRVNKNWHDSTIELLSHLKTTLQKHLRKTTF